MPLRPGHQAQVIRWLHERRAGAMVAAAADPQVAEALDAGSGWLVRADIATSARPVLGPGDGNLANHRWDGTRVRVVDFEESGRSDRPFELAEIAEHVSSRIDGEPEVLAFLGHFRLTPVETARLRDCRRLLARVRPVMQSFDDPAHPRNPPGTARRQAARLLRRPEDPRGTGG